MQFELLQDAAAALAAAKRVVAFTGAGISAESGVPTFRDAQTGLWAKFDPTELATPEAFRRDPERVWRWYLHRRVLMREAQPNAGHLALVEIERRVPEFLLATQNVDNLHREAGQQQMVELHGNLFRTVPFGGGAPVEIPDEPDEIPPRDPGTGRLLRPDVVWFGETLPADAVEQAFAAARQCDLLLSIGTSTQVYPAAQLPFTALEHGARVVEINPETTPLTGQATWTLRAPAAEVLPQLVSLAWPA